MIKINDELLIEIGLGKLPKPDRDSLLDKFYETLQIRVGQKLADKMTPAQMDEFEIYYNAQDQKSALNFLETNFPDYKSTVQTEFDKLKVELINSVPQILATIPEEN
jgi:hypothetical protein